MICFRLYEARWWDYFCDMNPDESYINLQKELMHLSEISDRTGKISRIKKQLEKKFMVAWNFAPDRLRLGAKLCNTIESFRTREDNQVRGFDHEKFYTGIHDQRIIVTQPYDILRSEIETDLTLNDGIHPEVIDATEWAFYNPGRAGLFIVEFPYGFEKAMVAFKKKIDREEIEAFLR